MRTKSGGWKWILGRGNVVEKDAEGKPLRMLGTHTDIDGIKRVKISLRDSEERWRDLFVRTSNAIAVSLIPHQNNTKPR